MEDGDECDEQTAGKANKSEKIPRHRIRIPLKLLGKKFSRTSRLVASSKVLHNAIPTKNCDIVMMLPARTDDSTLMWLLARLRSRTPHIHVHVRHLKNTGVYGFYMTATYENLLHGAEELGIRKPLRHEFGGGVKEFVFEEQDCFEGVDDERCFLSSQDRQSIVYNMLANLRALEGESLGSITFVEGQSIVPLLESKNIVTKVFPLHDSACLTELRRTWVQAFFHRQPLGAICEYFGVKIALYFAYLGHYTSALVIPTVVGIVVWFLQQESQVTEDLCFVMFALFNVFWATVYLVHWKRKNAELAYRWSTLDKKDELLADPRALYTGYLVTSPVTGRQEPFYPPWKRNLFRYCISFPVIGLCLSCVFYVMLLIFQMQEWVNGLVKNEDIPAFFRFLPKIFLALVIGILDEIYKKIAYWLTDKENYRMEESYENHLIIKLVLFQFVNSFLSLFYIAFYLQDMDRLREQLAALLITRQVIGNIREALVPYLLWKLKLIKVGYDMTGHMSPNTIEKEIKSMADEIGVAGDHAPDEPLTPGTGQHPDRVTSHGSALILTQAEMESTMHKYEGTFEDYLEMFIQYGYVILFSSAFPLAALCALVNNVIEIRSDAFKLCMNHQRPFGKTVSNIGSWQDALEVMSVIAVVVNCALIGVSGQMKRMHPHLDTISVIILIVVLEHVILMLKTCIQYAIPDTPAWIATELARLEFQRREALKSLESHSSGSPRDRASPFGRPATSPLPSPLCEGVKPPPRTSISMSPTQPSAPGRNSIFTVKTSEPLHPIARPAGSPTSSVPSSLSSSTSLPAPAATSSLSTSSSLSSSSSSPTASGESQSGKVPLPVAPDSPGEEHGNNPFDLPLRGLRHIISAKAKYRTDPTSSLNRVIADRQGREEGQQSDTTPKTGSLPGDESSGAQPKAAVGFSNPNAQVESTPSTNAAGSGRETTCNSAVRHRSSRV